LSDSRHGRVGRTVVRTYPVTFLHDVTQEHYTPDWHQLIFASSGHLEVITEGARRVVPSDRAVWIPAGTRHTDVMRAPISMRSVYVAKRHARAKLPGDVRTVAVTPLLREVILHVTRLGALENDRGPHARLAGVLIDLLAAAAPVGSELSAPKDPRARRFADLVTAKPGDARSSAQLARKAGASLRTLERCFLAETGVGVGTWRRRVRLFHAVRLLEGGASVGEVADAVGYESVSAFCQAFARQFGRSPTGRTRSR
jgi:AraC-like DNA-binding protein